METFFKDVYKLPQGCYYIFENGTMQVHSYGIRMVYTTEEKSEDEWTDIVDQTVHESVAAHQISDVPVGSFLSGGVDSSYITAWSHPDNTFSVCFKTATNALTKPHTHRNFPNILAFTISPK